MRVTHPHDSIKIQTQIWFGVLLNFQVFMKILDHFIIYIHILKMANKIQGLRSSLNTIILRKIPCWETKNFSENIKNYHILYFFAGIVEELFQTNSKVYSDKL